MRTLVLLALLALSGVAQATNNHNNDGCRGNCAQPSTAVSGSVSDADANAAALAAASADVDVGIKNSNTNVIGVGVDVSNKNYNTDINDNRDFNSNTNVAYGGRGGEGGDAYAAGGSARQDQGQDQSQAQQQGQTQGQSQSASANNAQANSQSINIEGTGEAEHYNKYGNNVGAYAPAIYSSSACTAGGVSAGAAGMGFGVSVGGAKQDIQCQVRENARILAGLDADLAITYLCKNDKVDIGAVLGAACKPPVVPAPPVVLPEPPVAPAPPIEVIHDDVKG